MSMPEIRLDDDRPVVSRRTIDIAVSTLLLLAAVVLGWDNWSIGAGWASDGPQAGYFPFYLCVLLALASLYGLVSAFLERDEEIFVTRGQLRRVLQVAVPSALFVLCIEFLGIYVASFLLIIGFMMVLGKSSLLKSVITAAVFVVFMFYVFEVQFTVLLPKGPIESALFY